MARPPQPIREMEYSTNDPGVQDPIFVAKHSFSSDPQNDPLPCTQHNITANLVFHSAYDVIGLSHISRHYVSRQRSSHNNLSFSFPKGAFL